MIVPFQKQCSLFSLAIAAATVAVNNLVYSTDASTYQLNYDGIISPTLITERKESPSLVEEVTKLVASFIEQNEEVNDTNTSFELNCFLPREIFVPGKDGSVLMDSTKCVADYRKPGLLSFSITTSIYPSGDDDGAPVAIMVDATVKTVQEDGIMLEGRDSLVNAVPIIDESISYHGDDHEEEEKPMSTWNVRERPSPAGRNDMGTYNTVSFSPSASIESKIFAKDGIEDKTQVHSSKSLLSRVDIWEFRSVATEQSYRDIFLDSTLRATTSAAGKAHAEAFVHPALVSQVLPSRVAVISDLPVAYVKEILKYKSVTDITLLGANIEAVEAVKTHMPQLSNCSLIEGVADSCMDDGRLEIVLDDVEAWITDKAKECEGIDYYSSCEYDEDESKYIICAPPPKYDVILVDVSSLRQGEEWLSAEFYEKLRGITTFESLIVINAGSPPDIDGGLDYDERDRFFGLLDKDRYDVAMVYDEPTAAPLNTAFISVFGMMSETYYRYVRETHTSTDLDMIRRMHSQSLPLTEFYDGSTHLRYLRPSHAWENWFCGSSIGEDSLECTIMLKNWFNASNHGFRTEVVRDPIKGRSLHAAEDIPKGAFVLGDDTHMHLHIDSHQWEALNDFVKEFPDAKLYKELRDFFLIYGFENEPNGLSGWSVSVANNNTFTNHACTKADAKVRAFPYSDDPKLLDQVDHSTFSVVLNRHPKLAMATGALRDIKKGEEIMMDYSDFRSEEDIKFTEFLDGICNTGVGLVDASDGSSMDSCINEGTCY